MNIVSLSYGKDSLALFGACEKLGIPVHGAVHAEIWATDDVPADLPPMVEFKKKADAIIKERWGIEVKHICAMWGGKELISENLLQSQRKRKSYRNYMRIPKTAWGLVQFKTQS